MQYSIASFGHTSLNTTGWFTKHTLLYASLNTHTHTILQCLILLHIFTYLCRKDFLLTHQNKFSVVLYLKHIYGVYRLKTPVCMLIYNYQYIKWDILWSMCQLGVNVPLGVM